MIKKLILLSSFITCLPLCASGQAQQQQQPPVTDQTILQFIGANKDDMRLQLLRKSFEEGCGFPKVAHTNIRTTAQDLLRARALCTSQECKLGQTAFFALQDYLNNIEQDVKTTDLTDAYRSSSLNEGVINTLANPTIKRRVRYGAQKVMYATRASLFMIGEKFDESNHPLTTLENSSLLTTGGHIQKAEGVESFVRSLYSWVQEDISGKKYTPARSTRSEYRQKEDIIRYTLRFSEVAAHDMPRLNKHIDDQSFKDFTIELFGETSKRNLIRDDYAIFQFAKRIWDENIGDKTPHKGFLQNSNYKLGELQTNINGVRVILEHCKYNQDGRANLTFLIEIEGDKTDRALTWLSKMYPSYRFTQEDLENDLARTDEPEIIDEKDAPTYAQYKHLCTWKDGEKPTEAQIKEFKLKAQAEFTEKSKQREQARAAKKEELRQARIKQAEKIVLELRKSSQSTSDNQPSTSAESTQKTPAVATSEPVAQMPAQPTIAAAAGQTTPTTVNAQK